MTDYQIQPNTRRCAITGRELRPGERFYTALLEVGNKFVRQDYCAESWTGLPEGAFSFWSGSVPTESGRASRISTTTCLSSASSDLKDKTTRAD